MSLINILKHWTTLNLTFFEKPTSYDDDIVKEYNLHRNNLHRKFCEFNGNEYQCISSWYKVSWMNIDFKIKLEIS